MVLDNETGLSEEVLAAIHAELNKRFAPHAGDPLYDEIKRVRRQELIEIEQRKLSGA